MKGQPWISWRTYLKNIAEIDDYISLKEYADLYGLPHCNVKEHFKRLYAWGFTIRKAIKGSKGGRPYHMYKINQKGLDKVEFIKRRYAEYRK